LVAVGFVTPVQLAVTAPDETVAFDALTRRSEPAVAVFAVQPVVAPIPVGCAPIAEPVTENPLGVHELPVALVQNWICIDFTAVVVGRAAVESVYVTPVAPPTDVLSVRDRPVIWAAFAIGTCNSGAAVKIRALTPIIMLRGISASFLNLFIRRVLLISS
jgi:hypothetical protein